MVFYVEREFKLAHNFGCYMWHTNCGERERALRVYLRLDFMIVSLCHFCNFSIFLVKHYSRCTHGHRHKFEPRNS